MHTLGRHLICELYGCDPAHLDDEARVLGALVDAAAAVGAEVVGRLSHRFAPQGVTATVLIAESHLSGHTWPEHGYAAFDVFTCGGLDPRPAFAVLARAMGAREGRVQELLRGIDAHLPPGPLRPADVAVLAELRPLEPLEGPRGG
jgi:S-adenosylmethionine decarboxylase